MHINPIKSRPLSPEGRENYDRIFRKNKTETCNLCGGTGLDAAHQWPDESNASCEQCEGSGEVDVSMPVDFATAPLKECLYGKNPKWEWMNKHIDESA